MSGIAFFAPALYNALIAAANRPAGLEIVQHSPPGESRTYPYLVVGDLTEVPEGKTFRKKAWSNTIALHGFSDYEGSKEIRGITEWLNTTVEAMNLVLATNQVAQLRIDSADIFQDPDGKYHLLMRVRGRIRAS
jgi:hypothetical protein